jgi:AbiV family abortive infection protein
MTVTSDYLLEGALLALEQAGKLFNDADILYRNGSFSSAIALAATGLEELGKCKLYRDLETELRAGKTLTPKMIKERTKDHERKHEKALAGVGISGARGTKLGVSSERILM